MKRLFAALVSTSTLVIGGCADETPPAEEVREQFQRGITGEGQLGPIDRRDDPYVQSREPAPVPPPR
ncbi:MAG: hypothetical protein ABJB32_01600 [Verrucomicrobiota bacterium]